MDQIAPINRSIILTSKESLTEIEHDDLPSEFLPSVILSEVYKDKSGKTIYPEIPKETKALHWALNRLANWDLPGKEHVGEYIRGSVKNLSLLFAVSFSVSDGLSKFEVPLFEQFHV